MPNPDAFTALGKHQTTFTNLDVFDRPEHVHDAIALGINPGGYSSRLEPHNGGCPRQAQALLPGG